MEGHYLEAGYDIMEFIDEDSAQQLLPFIRYEGVDTHAEVASGFSRDSAQDETIWTLGLQWLPHDQIVFKASYQEFDEGEGL